jgi:predicted Zn-dependent protease with MMP-like domain
MSPAERDRFDRLIERVIDQLPDRLRDLLEEIPVVVEDAPSPEVLGFFGIDPSDPDARTELCGLHTGVSLTERSVEDTDLLPTDIELYREGIVSLAGGWRGPDADERVLREIRVTLLHEIGHHFGLEEDDLADLGYD